MEKLFFFDETFYWGRSGKRATVIEAECELMQDVRPDELRAAVLSALRVHRNFRARPRIVERRFLVETSEVEQVTVVSEDEGPRSLGTKETEGAHALCQLRRAALHAPRVPRAWRHAVYLCFPPYRPEVLLPYR